MPVVVSPTERIALGERINVAPTGKKFRSNFIEPGLISYKDNPNGAVELLRAETIREALNSMIDSPLTIRHPARPWTKAQVENGVVIEVGRDNESGWFWAAGTVDTDKARERINAGDGVSCGFDVLETDETAGTWHNIPYARELTKIRFHHLAIVEHPRIEDADIRLNATSTALPMFKFLSKLSRKKADNTGDEVVEQTHELPADATVKIDGKDVRLNELAASHVKRLSDEAAAAESARITQKAKDDEAAAAAARNNAATITDETVIDLGGGKSATVKELKAGKTAADAAVVRENARLEEEKKTGKQAFATLAEARNNAAAQPPVRKNSSGTIDEKMLRGELMFGNAAQRENAKKLLHGEN